ncbi:hypothetical protein K458DRAFT_47360 [Lentithecium fluviatile CBS 122367]|uniref:Uncharacterized protein n=1 Tax=Lentithecium fluviatile CBS 122367 TaxID=1168545 RepID=A0A6G1IZ38_9PLEO|nr:hypothetical protein K458DRAFT_47360 [Lentithecium fluviatile CBS 122367]
MRHSLQQRDSKRIRLWQGSNVGDEKNFTTQSGFFRVLTQPRFICLLLGLTWLQAWSWPDIMAPDALPSSVGLAWAKTFEESPVPHPKIDKFAFTSAEGPR